MGLSENVSPPNVEGRFRVWMMYMIMLSQVVIYAQRTTLEQVVYFANTDHDCNGTTLDCPARPLTEYERATLQSAFYWGYVPFQVVGAAISKRIGAKAAITSGMIGAALMGVLPFTLQLGFVAATACAFCMGALQAAYVPAQAQLLSYWLPKSEVSGWKPILSVGSRAGRSAAVALIPVLVMGSTYTPPFGWQAPCLLVTAIAVAGVLLWHSTASSTPAHNAIISKEEQLMLDQECAAGPELVDETEIKNEKSTGMIKSNLSIITTLFSEPSARAIIILQFANNWITSVMDLTGPAYYKETYDFTPQTAGYIVAATKVFGIPFAYVVVMIESYLLKRTSRLFVRRFASGACIMFSGVLLLVLCVEPPAAVAVCCHVMIVAILALQCIGYSTGYIEVGATNAGVFSALGNQIANTSGLLVPFVGTYLRQHSGGKLSSTLVLSAMICIACGANYLYACDVKPVFAARNTPHPSPTKTKPLKKTE